jgi:hypothetical protein
VIVSVQCIGTKNGLGLAFPLVAELLWSDWHKSGLVPGSVENFRQ